MSKVKKGVRLENVSKIYQDPKTKKSFMLSIIYRWILHRESLLHSLDPQAAGKPPRFV